MVEPYLLQQGLIQRTPRGRMLSTAGFKHIGLNPPSEVLVQLDLLAQMGGDDE
uniref:Holliday junction resolvasome, helicase subunit n=1 Tax=Magnetospirillum gryphiswaldense TaxID=55518 RepID=A4TTN5_9PROT|nr:Holliday junction resolvasome, helicase subunit [Magnetospirillum gryphiswaldense MSR-1]